MKIENIKAFVKRDRDAVMIEEMGELVPHYFYGDNHKVYELNAMTCLLIITGKSELIKTVRPIATEDGDVEWTMENDLIGGYYKDEHDNKVPVMDKNVVAYINNDNELVILDYSFVNRSLEMMSNTYVTLDTWSKSHGKSVPAAKRQCQLGRVRGAVQVGSLWLIPELSPYPERVSDDEKVFEVPESALSDVTYEFLNQCMLNGLYELPCGIKIKSYPEEGVRLSIEIPCYFREIIHNYSCDVYEDITRTFVEEGDGFYASVGGLLPDSFLVLMSNTFCNHNNEYYNKINVMSNYEYSLIDERLYKWQDDDEYSDASFYNNRSAIDIINYMKVLNYFCDMNKNFFVDFDGDIFRDFIHNKINKLNVLFFTTDDPIILSCLTNVESFKEHMDELLK